MTAVLKLPSLEDVSLQAFNSYGGEEVSSTANVHVTPGSVPSWHVRAKSLVTKSKLSNQNRQSISQSLQVSSDC
eukprot:scaffold207_cov409-Prasinococcus_capsulatus_cf.AAC.131